MATTEPTASRPGDLPGQMILTTELPVGCEDCDDSLYQLWTAGPRWRFDLLSADAWEHRPGEPIKPAVSPDGRWLLYTGEDERLIVRQTATPGGAFVGPRHVVPVAVRRGVSVAWAPDSAHLVLAGTIGGVNGLWICDRDGSSLRRIVSGDTVEVDGGDDTTVPAWSPASGIAFVGASPNRPASRRDARAIYVVRPDGTSLRQATTPVAPTTGGRTSGGADAAPAWSPDGSRLAFVRNFANVWVLTLASGVEREFASNAEAAAFSPDGRRLAVVINSKTRPIRVLRRDGTPTHVVTIGPFEGYPLAVEWRAR